MGKAPHLSEPCVGDVCDGSGLTCHWHTLGSRPSAGLPPSPACPPPCPSPSSEAAAPPGNYTSHSSIFLPEHRELRSHTLNDPNPDISYTVMYMLRHATQIRHLITEDKQNLHGTHIIGKYPQVQCHGKHHWQSPRKRKQGTRHFFHTITLPLYNR